MQSARSLGRRPLMFRLLVRLALAALLAAFVTAAAFSGWSVVRLLCATEELDWPAEVRSRLEPLLVACAGAALAGGGLHLLAARRRRHLLAQAERHLAHLRDEPSVSATTDPELAAVRGEADALAARCH